ncbi:hypothetical protein E2C01_053755 [Portunus trituberculatus]|uniref:Uncharacterized protein n=1 Tax=Portunus trituberculatus TaxID=210409 RepID=A0A5B7GRB9_PORTR|nr:hypothetical protein [Portunus trituberculatus]
METVEGQAAEGAQDKYGHPADSMRDDMRLAECIWKWKRSYLKRKNAVPVSSCWVKRDSLPWMSPSSTFRDACVVGPVSRGCRRGVMARRGRTLLFDS